MGRNKKTPSAMVRIPLDVIRFISEHVRHPEPFGDCLRRLLGLPKPLTEKSENEKDEKKD